MWSDDNFRLNFSDLLFVCYDVRLDLLYFHVFLGLRSRLLWIDDIYVGFLYEFW